MESEGAYHPLRVPDKQQRDASPAETCLGTTIAKPRFCQAGFSDACGRAALSAGVLGVSRGRLLIFSCGTAIIKCMMCSVRGAAERFSDDAALPRGEVSE